MNEVLENQKYLVVKNFVPESLLDLCKNYYTIKFMIQKDFSTCAGQYVSDFPDIVKPASIFSYSDALTESIMLQMLPDMRDITGIDLLEPSYSFVRFYEKGNWLDKHMDRPSCQYSVTLPLMSHDDTPWSIYIAGNAIDLELGDMLVYKGEEAEHWREPYTGEYQVQAHLHYIDFSDSQHMSYIRDGRSSYGEKK